MRGPHAIINISLAPETYWRLNPACVRAGAGPALDLHQAGHGQEKGEGRADGERRPGEASQQNAPPAPGQRRSPRQRVLQSLASCWPILALSSMDFDGICIHTSPSPLFSRRTAPVDVLTGFIM